MNKRILFLSYYYTPEITADQHLNFELCLELVKKGFDVQVGDKPLNAPREVGNRAVLECFARNERKSFGSYQHDGKGFWQI